MRGTRHSGRRLQGDAAVVVRPRHDRTPVRKRGTLRTAVTVAAAGVAVTLPVGSQALAQLNPVVLRQLHLDSATLHKVKAYDRYRTREAKQRERARTALRFARKQIGKPYRWGATGPSGYDCSGLAMTSWRRAGVAIPRVTYAQYAGVKRKVGLRNLRPGDLIFFHGRSHVGLYLGHGRFLHAPSTGSRIRIDRLDAARRRQFAGAVRPGAPAYRKWSPSVRELVDKIDRMSAHQHGTKQKPPAAAPHAAPDLIGGEATSPDELFPEPFAKGPSRTPRRSPALRPAAQLDEPFFTIPDEPFLAAFSRRTPGRHIARVHASGPAPTIGTRTHYGTGDRSAHGTHGRTDHDSEGRIEHGTGGRTDHSTGGGIEHGTRGRTGHGTGGRIDHGTGSADHETALDPAPKPAGEQAAPEAGVQTHLWKTFTEEPSDDD